MNNHDRYDTIEGMLDRIEAKVKSGQVTSDELHYIIDNAIKVLDFWVNKTEDPRVDKIIGDTQHRLKKILSSTDKYIITFGTADSSKEIWNDIAQATITALKDFLQMMTSINL